MTRYATPRACVRSAVRSATRPATGVSGTNPLALAYADKVSLGGSETARLSGFLDDLDGIAGLANVNHLFLGRSEFKVLSGLTIRAVIGGDATAVASGVGMDTKGLTFSGASGSAVSQASFPLATPLQAASIPGSLSVIQEIERLNSARGYGFYTQDAANTGFYLNGNDTGTVTAKVSYPASSSASVLSSQKCWRLGNGHGLGSIHWSDAQSAGNLQAGTFTDRQFKPSPASLTAWRGGSTVGWLAGWGANVNKMACNISFTLIAQVDFTPLLTARLQNALWKWGIGSSVYPSVSLFVGDSMTVGGRRDYFAQEKTSNWQGSFYEVRAAGGNNVNQQRTNFDILLRQMQAMPNAPCPRYIHFRGGYNAINESGGSIATTADAEWLADQYLEMAAQCDAAGVSTYHSRRLMDGDWAFSETPGSVWALFTYFNDYYETGIATLNASGNATHLWYDHRDTFGDTLDGTTRLTAYKDAGGTDQIHLTDAAEELIIDDMMTVHPDP
jgi:hypothetical protein